MDFTYCEFPSTVSIDTFKAYFDSSNVRLPKIENLSSEVPVEDQVKQVKSLRHLVLDAIVSNWSGKKSVKRKRREYWAIIIPMFAELPLYRQLRRRQDRNYLLSQLDTQLPLQLLSSQIRDDYFWRRCYKLRWRLVSPQQVAHTGARRQQRRWINIYMERHVQEFIENMQTGDYEQEGNVQAALDICAAYINQLEINQLQPAPPGSDSNGE